LNSSISKGIDEGVDILSNFKNSISKGIDEGVDILSNFKFNFKRH